MAVEEGALGVDFFALGIYKYLKINSFYKFGANKLTKITKEMCILHSYFLKSFFLRFSWK
jgi:hypothetical protein